MNGFDIKDRLTQILALVVLTMLISIYGAYQAHQANENADWAFQYAVEAKIEASSCVKAN